MKACTILLASLLLATHAGVARAQAADTSRISRPGWSLERTMGTFIDDLYDAREFFPTRGEWTWVLTTHYAGRPDSVGPWRFPAAQTDSAIGFNGPVCDAFRSGDYVVLGTLVSRAGARPWRRVSGTRFVPPESGARSPVFVEWRREDERWVVASFGGEGDYMPPRPPDPALAPRGARAPLRLPLADTARVAAGAQWYESNEPITFAGYRLVKYGLPRQLQESDLERWGTLNGVDVYGERGSNPSIIEVVYLPVDRAGSFHAYQNEMGNGCAQ
jgi:hypothetical protein